MADLIIVESPSKAKTLKNYLGSGYEVIASKGHVRDLPAAKLSVDVKNDFTPKYSIVKGKEKLVKELGDVCWYVAEIATALDVPLEDVMQRNIDKLRARYPEGFDTLRSQHRENE